MHAIILSASEPIQLDPTQLLGIPLALVGAFMLSLGAQFQHGGVSKVDGATEGPKGLNIRQMLKLLMRPAWLLGGVFLILAIVFQLSSLAVAPIIVVQPIGAIALVITSVLNARISKTKLNLLSIIAIFMCVAGIFLFVIIAAFTAIDRKILDSDLYVILAFLLAILVVTAIVFLKNRKHIQALFYVVMAGVLFGFVATLAKVVLGRILQGDFDPLVVVCIVGLGLAALLGSFFVQNAYASGPPDLVIAGLTVIDPLVAVLIGVLLLGEAAQAPLWAIGFFVGAGLIAVIGVFMLARFHPQNQTDLNTAVAPTAGE